MFLFCPSACYSLSETNKKGVSTELARCGPAAPFNMCDSGTGCLGHSSILRADLETQPCLPVPPKPLCPSHSVPPHDMLAQKALGHHKFFPRPWVVKGTPKAKEHLRSRCLLGGELREELQGWQLLIVPVPTDLYLYGHNVAAGRREWGPNLKESSIV